MATETSQGERRVWPSLDLASRIADIANIFFIASLVVGVVSTVVIVWTAGVKEDWWDKDRRESGVEIAKANARAEEARAEAAKAQLALEKFRSPRKLAPEQQARITEKVKAFKGTQFDAAVPPGDPEPERLLTMIETALTAAGWNEISWRNNSGIAYTRQGRPDLGMASATNVIIAVPPDDQPSLIPAATALANALTAEGIDAQAQDGRGIVNTNPKTIHILVGRKM